MHPRVRCKKIISECEQMIRDVEWWNRNRTDALPLDCEPERVLLPVARACLAAWNSGDMAKVRELSRKMIEVSGGGF